jgi:hypothetical protein
MGADVEGQAVGHRAETARRGSSITYIQDPVTWVENNRIQRIQRREAQLPLLRILNGHAVAR